MGTNGFSPKLWFYVKLLEPDHPTARLIPVVEEITDDIDGVAGGSISGLGTGGMATKVRAAKMCMESGTDMVIANGANPHILYDIVDGKRVGTKFIGKKQ